MATGSGRPLLYIIVAYSFPSTVKKMTLISKYLNLNTHFHDFYIILVSTCQILPSYECFILRTVRLFNKLLGQGYVKERLRSSLGKFYGWYGDLIKQYEVPLSRMLHHTLDDDHLQWHPPLIRHYTNFALITDLDLITEFDSLPNCERFP